MISDNIIDLGKFTSAPSSSDDLYIWADYCEIACLLSVEKNLSDEEIYKSFYVSKDLKPEDISLSNKDKVIGLIRDALYQIALRDSLLVTKYPFSFNQDDMRVCLKEHLNYGQQVYITLLFASNLQYVRKKQENIFTSSFESISLYTMREILPNATLKLFGSSNTDILNGNDKFSSVKLKERIQELASMVYQRHIKEEVDLISEKNHGDYGLDIVGFINLKDERSSHPLFFVQCACSKEKWDEKQKTTLRNEWMKYMMLTDTSIHNFILVPFMYIDNEKNWTNRQKITQNIMIDRLRIMNVITEERPFTTKALEVVKKDLELTA